MFEVIAKCLSILVAQTQIQLATAEKVLPHFRYHCEVRYKANKQKEHRCYKKRKSKFKEMIIKDLIENTIDFTNCSMRKEGEDY